MLGGCGGSDPSKQQAKKLPQPALPVALRYAKCSDWRKGTIAQREGTVVRIREFAGGPVGSSQGIQRGRVLDDGQAYAILDRFCSKRYARGFRLYLLYVRAAAFAGRVQSSRGLGGGF